MESKKKIAEEKARKVMEWYSKESKKIADKYKDIPGMDNGVSENKKLTQQAFRKIQAIKKKYDIE
ncbi:hypothetical protein [Acetivibrio sp. MSJd-27]|uniref:hypothetical protein n=1 Tax=Acetivibrio sp. MSJd-27 TaxID=2841523 RepID=UPI001C122878|nr:hypothetical protein [Acetivibrio sp. MSJd-27]MBU5451105.1 hypothetical protein [Acetivibrio sp. MSJd-27]